jgi:hypothetical protein
MSSSHFLYPWTLTRLWSTAPLSPISSRVLRENWHNVGWNRSQPPTRTTSPVARARCHPGVYRHSLPLGTAYPAVPEWCPIYSPPKGLPIRVSAGIGTNALYRVTSLGFKSTSKEDFTKESIVRATDWGKSGNSILTMRLVILS